MPLQMLKQLKHQKEHQSLHQYEHQNFLLYDANSKFHELHT